MRIHQMVVLAVLLVSQSEYLSMGQFSTVSIVVDGDRIVLSDGTRLQLLGVDAPEKHLSAKLTREAARTGRSEEAVARQGEIAAAYLSVLALARSVRVEYEKPRAVRGRPGGPYTPALVYVVDEETIAYSLNERMLRDGYAFLDVHADFSLRIRFERLQDAARKERLGLWAESAPFAPSRPIESRASEGADPLSRCRDDPACLWVSRDGNVHGTGFWRSKSGMKCPCAGTP